MHYLELGGAEKSLVGLLQAIDYSRFDVDLFLYSHRGELMREIPKEVRLLPETVAYACIECPVKDALRKGQWGVAWGRLKAKWQYKRYARRMHPKDGSAIFQYVMNAVEPHLPSLHHLGEYDLAVSFLTPHNVVLKKVRAKRKACWIHTDYTQIDVNTALELPVWSGYDHIVSISAGVTKAFLSVFPTLKDKIVEIHNILSAVFVRSRAEEMTAEEVAREMPREEGVINLLSVGRFSHAKNYDNVPSICRILNSQLSTANCLCRWYLIGYGGEEPLIRQRIAEEGMEGKVIILGKRENPYPFIKACDVYVQPSRYEGNAVTVREAQMLCKPVVITAYPTATSQIQDGTDGIIVPIDNEGCAKAIANFLCNKQEQEQVTSFLSVHDYGNMAEVLPFYQLIVTK
jgi:glycosyltransferase involved in cell wall biosynthesis